MMEIQANTKIGLLIKTNNASIEAIARLAKPLEKLRNPILRRLLAPRVSIEEAAKMGGCSLQDFVRALEPLGFVFSNGLPSETILDKLDVPNWLSTGSAPIHKLDVRPMLASGADPLKMIMQRFKVLAPGEILCIVNSFIPTPLIQVLGKNRALSFTKQEEPGVYHTYFLKAKSAQSIPGTPQVIQDDALSFEAVCHRFSIQQTKVLDVRFMEMPAPMESILKALEPLGQGEALLVHHKRIPVFLLDALAEKDFEVHIYFIEEGAVKMLLFKV